MWTAASVSPKPRGTFTRTCVKVQTAISDTRCTCSYHKYLTYIRTRKTSIIIIIVIIRGVRFRGVVHGGRFIYFFPFFTFGKRHPTAFVVVVT